MRVKSLDHRTSKKHNYFLRTRIHLGLVSNMKTRRTHVDGYWSIIFFLFKKILNYGHGWTRVGHSWTIYGHKRVKKVIFAKRVFFFFFLIK